MTPREAAHELFTWTDYTPEEAHQQGLTQAEYVEALMKFYFTGSDWPDPSEVRPHLADIVADNWPE